MTAIFYCVLAISVIYLGVFLKPVPFSLVSADSIEESAFVFARSLLNSVDKESLFRNINSIECQKATCQHYFSGRAGDAARMFGVYRECVKQHRDRHVKCQPHQNKIVRVDRVEIKTREASAVDCAQYPVVSDHSASFTLELRAKCLAVHLTPNVSVSSSIGIALDQCVPQSDAREACLWSHLEYDRVVFVTEWTMRATMVLLVIASLGCLYFAEDRLFAAQPNWADVRSLVLHVIPVAIFFLAGILHAVFGEILCSILCFIMFACIFCSFGRLVIAIDDEHSRRFLDADGDEGQNQGRARRGRRN